MKGILSCFLLMIMLSCTSTRIYIVRHAEKAAEPVADPGLTEAGIERAQQLSKMLDGKKIASIYSTHTTRTLETARPLSLKTGIRIQEYRNDTLARFLFRVIEQEKNTLIIGHSNTVLKMLDELQIAHKKKEITDSDYSNLFVITIKPRNPAGYRYQLKETTYGATPPKTRPL
jgi:phosphohistidine phosphatase SixA